MANLTYIKGVRTRYRNVLEIEIQSANDLIKSGKHTEDLENQVSNVTKCLEKIKSYSDKVEMQSEKLASAIGESDDEFTETIVNDDCKLYSDAMERYVDLISLREMLMLEKQREDSNKTKVEIEDENTTKLVQLQTDMQYLLAKQMRQQEVTNKKESEKFSSVKLPKIEMPSFNGDKTKWVEFWDSFQCSVHDNKRITNVEKFNYLKSKLSGEARSAIAGLALSNENYPIAVDILMKRFGNAQEIVDLHYNQLINLQPATNKVSSLRYLLDKVERHLRSLEVLGQSVDQDVFVSIIRSKLPEDVLIQLEIQNGVDEKWTVATLCESLHKYVVVRERAEKGNKSAMEKKGDHVSDRMSNRSLQHRRHVPEKTHAPIYKSSAQDLSLQKLDNTQRKGKIKHIPTSVVIVRKITGVMNVINIKPYLSAKIESKEVVTSVLKVVIHSILVRPTKCACIVVR